MFEVSEDAYVKVEDGGRLTLEMVDRDSERPTGGPG